MRGQSFISQPSIVNSMMMPNISSKYSNSDIDFVIRLYKAGLSKNSMGFSLLKKTNYFNISRKAFYDKMEKLEKAGIINVKNEKAKTFSFSEEFRNYIK